MKITIENVKRADRTFDELLIGDAFVFPDDLNNPRLKVGQNGDRSFFRSDSATFCRSDAAVRKILELKLVLEE